jgi:hypothetical protein
LGKVVVVRGGGEIIVLKGVVLKRGKGKATSNLNT